jgi:hypothetical protein
MNIGRLKRKHLNMLAFNRWPKSFPENNISGSSFNLHPDSNSWAVGKKIRPSTGFVMVNAIVNN